MGRIVIVAYRPKPGQQAALESLMRRHHARLLAHGLVTDRVPMLMSAADGTIVEVFEWMSAAAIWANEHCYRAVERPPPLRAAPRRHRAGARHLVGRRRPCHGSCSSGVVKDDADRPALAGEDSAHAMA